MATTTTKEIEGRLLDYAEARKAMGRITKAPARNIYDWLIVGRAMMDAREETFDKLGTNRDDTLAFRREFGAILHREKLHDEDPGGPDKGTRSLLVKIMQREAEVLKWHAELPKGERLAWNHPSSIWRHFDKEEKTALAKEKSNPITGPTKQEEAVVVEDTQVRVLQARDAKIESLRDDNRNLHATIDRLNAEVIKLRQVIGALLKRLGFEVSDIARDEEIVKATGDEGNPDKAANDEDFEE
jgi:hypothetical protein